MIKEQLAHYINLADKNVPRNSDQLKDMLDLINSFLEEDLFSLAIPEMTNYFTISWKHIHALREAYLTILPKDEALIRYYFDILKKLYLHICYTRDFFSEKLLRLIRTDLSGNDLKKAKKSLGLLSQHGTPLVQNELFSLLKEKNALYIEEDIINTLGKIGDGYASSRIWEMCKRSCKRAHLDALIDLDIPPLINSELNFDWSEYIHKYDRFKDDFEAVLGSGSLGLNEEEKEHYRQNILKTRYKPGTETTYRSLLLQPGDIILVRAKGARTFVMNTNLSPDLWGHLSLFTFIKGFPALVDVIGGKGSRAIPIEIYFQGKVLTPKRLPTFFHISALQLRIKQLKEAERERLIDVMEEFAFDEKNIYDITFAPDFDHNFYCSKTGAYIFDKAKIDVNFLLNPVPAALRNNFDLMGIPHHNIYNFLSYFMHPKISLEGDLFNGNSFFLFLDNEILDVFINNYLSNKTIALEHLFRYHLYIFVIKIISSKNCPKLIKDILYMFYRLVAIYRVPQGDLKSMAAYVIFARKLRAIGDRTTKAWKKSSKGNKKVSWFDRAIFLDFVHDFIKRESQKYFQSIFKE